MLVQRPLRPLAVLASALAAAGTALAVAGCSGVTPLGPEPAPVSLPPVRQLGSPIIMQVLRSQPPAPSGRCPAGSIALFGSEPNVPRAAVAPGSPVPAGSPGPPGVACYRPTGRPITITSAAVSSVATYPPPPSEPNGPADYGFVVAFPTPDVAALTAIIRRAYDARDAIGVSVAGKLWQAPQVLRPFSGRGAQISLFSRAQALRLHRLLVPPS